MSNEARIGGDDVLAGSAEARIDLFWLALGADGWLVRRCGAAYERLAARRAGRRPLDLYHAALEVTIAEGRFAIELSPIRSGAGSECGVIGEGPVGSPLLRHLRLFRYELHAVQGGAIPDIDEAVDLSAIGPPRHGRAPGWRAGIEAAHRADIGVIPPDRCGVPRMAPRGAGSTVESCP